METQTELKGLRGWLILVGFGVVVSPFGILATFNSNFLPIFYDGTWEAMSTVGSEAYSPLLMSIIIVEIVYNLAMFAIYFYLIYLFFVKHYLFPTFYIAIVAITLIFILLDAWLVSLILHDVSMFDPDTTKDFSRAFITCIIWIPYMLVSKRVKATFVEKVPNNN